MASSPHSAPTAQPLSPPSQQPRRRPSQGQLVEEVMAEQSCTYPLIDIAINLTDRSFDKDRDQVIERAHRAGIESLILTGCCLRTTNAARDLCANPPSAAIPLYYTAGIHPHNAKHCDGSTGIDALRQIASSDKHCVAVGECGLDFNRNFSPPDVQARIFAEQIELAEELKMPLLMHCRDAGPKFFEILRRHRKSVPGVVHCFTGSAEEAQEAIDLGLYIGITGWVCDDRPERGAKALAALLPLIPDDKLLLETDAPYLVPRSIASSSKKRPSRNEPALLPAVLHAVAAARGQSPEHVAAVTTENAKRLFGI